MRQKGKQPPTDPALLRQLTEALERKIADWGGRDTDARRVIWQCYAGDSQRQLRQALMEALTGEQRPGAKCGVSELERAYFAWQAKQTGPGPA